MMKTYVVIMILFVVGGTLFDIWHKKSAKYFFSNWRKAQDKGTKEIGGGGVAGLAIQTAASEVLTSSEFCNPKRRIAHLLTMYGFIAYAIATFVMVFWYTSPDSSTPFIWPLLWTLGALSVCVGGYWFWFAIRVDVSSEGHPWYRFARGDLFIVSLLATATFGLIWSFTQGGAAGWLFFVLFILSSTTLFGTVLCAALGWIGGNVGWVVAQARGAYDPNAGRIPVAAFVVRTIITLNTRLSRVPEATVKPMAKSTGRSLVASSPNTSRVERLHNSNELAVAENLGSWSGIRAMKSA